MFKMSSTVRQCPKCKTTDTSNKSLVMMVNECGHPICKNCVDNIFAKNSAPCPICGKVLRKNAYWEQKFDNPVIEREVFHRKRLSKIFCLKEDEFPNMRAYDDFLEKIENMVYNLVEGIDVEKTEAEIAKFKEQYAEAIERNKKKQSADDKWIAQMLTEETERQKRIAAEIDSENTQVKKKNAEDINKEVLDELMTAWLPAEVIVDKKRKQKIEQEIITRDEEKKKKATKLASRQEKVIFGSVAATGHPYLHSLPKLHISGPPLPSPEEMEKLGYFAHTPVPGKDKLAGGYTQTLTLNRYLFEARQDLFMGL